LDKIEISQAPFFYQGRPFLGNPFAVTFAGVTIEAEDFDIGGEGISFHAGANGANDNSRVYRADAGDGSEAVSLEGRNDGLTIGNFQIGDWTAYTLDVQEAGNYDIFLLMATNNDDRINRIEINDEFDYEVISHSSGWGNFEYARVSDVELKAGLQTLYVIINSNFDRIEIKKHVDISPYENTPQVIPGIIQAWKFDEGGQGLAFSVKNKTLGGENNPIRKDVEVPIGGNEADCYFIEVKEASTPSWLVYTVDVQETGYYKVTFKVEGNETAGTKFTLTGGLTPAVAVVPVVAGEWQDVTFSIIKLKEGLNTLTLASNDFGIKIASIEFERLDVISRSNWTVTVSDETASDGGGKIAMLDDDFGTYWHSQWTPSNVDLPHKAIFDLGAPAEISQIITIRRSNGDTKTLQYSVSNDLNLEEWPVIAAGEYALQSDGIHDLTLNATQTIKARYLKLVLAESFRAPFTSIAEVYVIGKTFEGIKPLATLPGKVYAENGVLKVKEFSATASLAVYNLLGQKIADYKAVNSGVEINLPSKGIYIVNVQDKGVTSSYKVIVQ
jgi:hypothetical protein